jgi:hypothetical protein
LVVVQGDQESKGARERAAAAEAVGRGEESERGNDERKGEGARARRAAIKKKAGGSVLFLISSSSERPNTREREREGKHKTQNTKHKTHKTKDLLIFISFHLPSISALSASSDALASPSSSAPLGL